MTHPTNPPSPRQQRRDPLLGGERRIEPPLAGDSLSGLEPLLGGSRRTGISLAHIQALINAPDEAERLRLLEAVIRAGQASLVAAELAQTIPERARQKVGNWRGTFTPTQRIAALDALSVIGGTECLPVVLGTLGDSEYRVREAAARALRGISARLDPADPRTRAAFSQMVEALRSLPVKGRKVVAHILAAAPADLVLGPLLQVGLTAEEWWARRETAWVLGTLADRRATRRLIAALLADPSAAVRAAAAWALGRLAVSLALDPLGEATRDSDEVVRAAAVEALGAHAARLSPQDGNYRPTIQRLIEALTDHDWSVRHAALDALLGLDGPEVRLATQGFRKR